MTVVCVSIKCDRVWPVCRQHRTITYAQSYRASGQPFLAMITRWRGEKTFDADAAATKITSQAQTNLQAQGKQN